MHSSSYPPPTLPVPNPTRSFWTHSSPDANPLATHGSTGPITADAGICIIGAGITGISAAYVLSQLLCDGESEGPWDVLILEARDFCARSFFFLSCLAYHHLSAGSG